MAKEDGLYLFQPLLSGLVDIGRIEVLERSVFSNFIISFVENGMSSFNNPSVLADNLIRKVTSKQFATQTCKPEPGNFGHTRPVPTDFFVDDIELI